MSRQRRTDAEIRGVEVTLAITTLRFLAFAPNYYRRRNFMRRFDICRSLHAFRDVANANAERG